MKKEWGLRSLDDKALIACFVPVFTKVQCRPATICSGISSMRPSCFKSAPEEYEVRLRDSGGAPRTTEEGGSNRRGSRTQSQLQLERFCFCVSSPSASLWPSEWLCSGPNEP